MSGLTAPRVLVGTITLLVLVIGLYLVISDGAFPLSSGPGEGGGRQEAGGPEDPGIGTGNPDPGGGRSAIPQPGDPAILGDNGLTGSVVDSAGRGVAGVEVILGQLDQLRQRHSYRSWQWGNRFGKQEPPFLPNLDDQEGSPVPQPRSEGKGLAGARVRTGADGSWVLAAAEVHSRATERIGLFLQGPRDYLPEPVVELTRTMLASGRVPPIELLKPSIISGHIVGPAEGPKTGRIHAWRHDGAGHVLQRRILDWSGEEGFSFQGLEPGRWRLALRYTPGVPGGRLFTWGPTLVLGREEHRQDVDIRAWLCCTLDVALYGPRREALPVPCRLGISLSRLGPPDTPEWDIRCKEFLGRFRVGPGRELHIGELAPGSYRLQARLVDAPDGPPAKEGTETAARGGRRNARVFTVDKTVTVIRGINRTELHFAELDRLGGLEVEVSDCQDQPLTGVPVRLQCIGPRLEYGPPLTKETDWEGRVSFTGLMPQDYFLFVGGQQYERQRIRLQYSRYPGTSQVRRFWLPSLGRLTGRVVDRLGAGVAGVEVTGTAMGKGSGRSYRRRVATDSAGRFQLPGLPYGRIVLVASRGEAQARLEVDLVRDGAQPVTLTLPD